MLIGDKGQSGGRRWEVSGFGLGPFSDSSKVRRLVVGFPDSGFSTGPRVSRWEVAGFALGAFSGSPKVHRWVLHFCLRGIFGVVPRSVAGCCI